jgi:hypothetical protein
MKRLTLPLSLAIVALLVWFFWPASQAPLPSSPAAPLPSAVPGAVPAAPRTPAPPPPASAERSTLADTLNSPATTVEADLKVVTEILAAFRTNFPRDGNPVGTNAEITAVLTGKNKLRLALIPPDHPAINQAGELCDRWGTPFFFHAESGTRMIVQSAGPDKKFHTADDISLSP